MNSAVDIRNIQGTMRNPYPYDDLNFYRPYLHKTRNGKHMVINATWDIAMTPECDTEREAWDIAKEKIATYKNEILSQWRQAVEQEKREQGRRFE